MSPNGENVQKEAERKALRVYLEGSRDEPFVIERSESYAVEEVLCYSCFSRLGLAWRYLLVWLGGIMPFCPLKAFFYRLAGVKIGRDVCFSPGAVIDPIFPSLIELADGCCLGMGCRLLAHEYTATHFRIGPIRVGKGSVVGTYATVRGGVTIGSKATVGANSFVNRDVPDGDVVGGVPARSLKSKRGER